MMFESDVKRRYRSIFLPLLLLIIAGCIDGCGKPPKNISYFRAYELNTKFEHVGISPISEETAATVNCYRFTYNAQKKPVLIECLRRGKLHVDSNDDFAGIVIEYTGRNERWTYKDCEDDYNSNDDDVYCVRITRTDDGRSLSKFNDDAQGSLLEDTRGVAYYMVKLDTEGRCISTIRKNGNDKQIVDNEGWYESRRVYDQRGNVIELANYGPDGTPLEARDGIALLHYVYDTEDRWIEVRQYGADGRLKANAKTGSAILKTCRNSLGEQTQFEYCDTHGRPVNTKHWSIAAIRMKYDEYGNRIQNAFFNADGKPCIEKTAGAACIRWTFDDAGNRVGESYYDVHDRPIDSRVSGFARIERTFDNRNKNTEIKFYGVDGRLREHRKSGIACVRMTYDETGEKIEERFFGADLNLKESLDEGYAISLWGLDAKNRWRIHTRLDRNGKEVKEKE